MTELLDGTADEAVLDEIVDLEEFARRGERPPLAKGYRYRVNGDPYVSRDARITGRKVLEAANLTPPENYTLRVTMAGHKPEKVGLDEVVNLRHPGIEKFKALPRDQTEG